MLCWAYAPRLFGNGRDHWRLAQDRGEFSGLSVAERPFLLLLRRIAMAKFFALFWGWADYKPKDWSNARPLNLIDAASSRDSSLAANPLIRCDRQS
jgi:hypothetical protein